MARTVERIAYVDLAAQHMPLKEELLAAVAEVIEHGQFILGEPVRLFEEQFATLCGTRFAVAVNSGTDALVLALRALGIGPGDEVLTVPNSFIASTSCILMVGARPRFVDVGADQNMDPSLLESAMTPRTKAILPVHLNGWPAEMGAILDVARRHDLAVVEDCSQAVLATAHGRRVGSFGDAGCFSLHPLKTLNACGDGGIVTTNDAALAHRVRLLRNLGLQDRETCVVWSGNSRLDNMQAAILLVKLKYLQGWTDARRAHAAFYRQALADVPGVQVPEERPGAWAVYHRFVIEAQRRDELKQFLAEHGIETAIHYAVPIHLQPAAAALGYGPGSFPVTERQAERILSLPVYPELGADGREDVAQAIREFSRR